MRASKPYVQIDPDVLEQARQIDLLSYLRAYDLIFFDWGNDGSIDHVGIVEKYENGTVYTVETNSGDACKQQSYPVGSNSIYDYGCPAY